MDELLSIFDAALLISTIRLVSPILLAALGGMFTQRAGIFNIALEGVSNGTLDPLSPLPGAVGNRAISSPPRPTSTI